MYATCILSDSTCLFFVCFCFFFFDSQHQALNLEQSGRPRESKTQEKVSEEHGRGGVAGKNARCPCTPGITRSDIMSSGRRRHEEWQCQSEKLPPSTGAVRSPAIINLSLVKYKDCKSQRDPAPLGGPSACQPQTLDNRPLFVGGASATYRCCSSLVLWWTHPFLSAAKVKVLT